MELDAQLLVCDLSSDEYDDLVSYAKQLLDILAQESHDLSKRATKDQLKAFLQRVKSLPQSAIVEL